MKGFSIKISRIPKRTIKYKVLGPGEPGIRSMWQEIEEVKNPSTEMTLQIGNWKKMWKWGKND